MIGVFLFQSIMLSSAIPFAFFWGAFNSIVINGPMAEELHEVIIISSLLGGGGGESAHHEKHAF